MDEAELDLVKTLAFSTVRPLWEALAARLEQDGVHIDDDLDEALVGFLVTSWVEAYSQGQASVIAELESQTATAMCSQCGAEVTTRIHVNLPDHTGPAPE